MNRTDIKDFRIRLNLTQSELAKKLGINYHTVMRWEKGYTKPSPLSVNALDALEMTSSGNIAVLGGTGGRKKTTIAQRIKSLLRWN